MSVIVGSYTDHVWYSRFILLARGGVILLSVGFIVLFAVLASLRMGYPYMLEWSESATFDEVRWIAAGRSPYGPPEIAFLPLPYTPLYFYLSAAMTKFVGSGILAPRLISTLATFGCFALLVAVVYQGTHRFEAGLLAAGIYAASFRFTGAWMDLAKTDSLFLMLVLLAYWLGIRNSRRASLLLSGGLFALAYFTKQLALPIVLVLAPISLITTRGRSWLQWASALVLGLGLFWLQDAATDGWSSFYTVVGPLYHERVLTIGSYWASLLRVMWPSFALVALVSILIYRSARSNPQWQGAIPWLYLGFAAALILASWSIYFKVWTYDNGMMPAALGLALLVGLAYDGLLSLGGDSSFTSLKKAIVQVSGFTLIFIQFGLLYYNPVQQLPTARDRSETQDFIQFTRQLPGKVWVIGHTYYGYLAGEEPYIHSAPLADMFAGRTPPPGTDAFRRREMAVGEFQSALSEQYFDWIIVDKLEPYWMPYYVAVDRLPYEFYPVTGAPARPQILLKRNPAIQSESFNP